MSYNNGVSGEWSPAKRRAGTVPKKITLNRSRKQELTVGGGKNRQTVDVVVRKKVTLSRPAEGAALDPDAERAEILRKLEESRARNLAEQEQLAQQDRERAEQAAERKRQEMLDALLKASRGGLDPIYCDTSPCTLRLVQGLTDQRLDMYDPVRFIRTHLLDKLEFVPQDKPIAVHVTCSTQHLGEAQALIDIARRCANEVVIPEGIHCCGFAGDKGFTTPELNEHALRSLKNAVQICEEGISTSRTCEIGLSRHGEIDYHGLVYLVDRVTRRKTADQPL